jgi:hypothetical protein
LTDFVLSRYVVQQHQAMSYEKTLTGDRCILQVDGPRIVSAGGFDKIGMGNPRLRSAIQILTDVNLLEEDEEEVTRLTSGGEAFLKEEMVREATHEVP